MDVLDRPQQGAEVLGVPGAGKERLAVSAGAFLCPYCEVVGLVGQGAHAAGPDVERVGEVGGAVGDALTEFGPRFDDDDAHGYGPEDMNRGQNPRRAPADDGDHLAWR